MKKYLPLILVAVGLVVVAGAFILVKGKNKVEPDGEEEEVVVEIPFDKRPFVSLTPTEDGHWLNLVIKNIKLDASTMDYELLYLLPDGRTQGVPGTITLGDQDMIERKLLLGSESSGKFRYDEGVKGGTLSLRFRNDKGKLMGKLSTPFTLLSNTANLVSEDTKFTYTLDKKPQKAFFVVMDTFGVPESITGTPTALYGVFSHSDSNTEGEITGLNNAKLYDGKGWDDLDDNKSNSIGVFASF